MLYLKSGVLNRVDPDGSDNRSLGLRPSSGFGPTPNMWFWSDADADGAVGTLSLYVPGTSTTTELEGRVATDAFTVSPDGRAALAVTRVRDLGANTTSTRAAALEWLPIDGPPRVLLDGFTLGPWDARTRQHACSPQLAVMSDRRALAIVCPTPGSAERALYAIDVVMSSVTEVARGVQSFLRPSTDGSFALFIDREQRFAGVSAAGDRVQRLIEPRRVTSVALLEGARFAYTTASKDVSFAGWPNMIPSSVLPLGADAIEAVSPDGRWLIFRQIRATSGLRDLFLINTVTSTTAPVVLEAEQTGYPGDDAFSLDSAHVQWFGSADANFIGAIRTRPTAGGPSVTLAEKGWIVSNHADPEQVVLLANARFTGGEARRLRVDLSVARRDGSAHRTIAVDVDPAAFELFPERDRAVFRVAEGVHAGLWVADLR